MAKLSSMLLLISLTCFNVTAQVDQASLGGTVVDNSRSSIPGAKVEILSTVTGFRRQTMTNNAGSYQLPALPVGTYTITIFKEGFRTAEFKDEVVHVAG